jgi:uncharacterized protein
MKTGMKNGAKRFQLVVLSAAAVAALFLVQGVGAQAPKTDVASLIQAGDIKQALELIRSGADVNQAQPDGSTPLLWAVNRSEVEAVEALLAKKANPNVGNEFGSLPITEAARLNDARMVKMLLDAGAKVDSANPDGETTLMLAIKAGNLEMFQGLLNAGANVNVIEKFHNQTPLMYAASNARADMVAQLLAKGADVKPRALYSDWPSQITSEPRWQFRSVGGLNALLYATRSGCYECVERLLAAGADMNLPTPEGVTPMMIALDNSHNDVAKLLMDKGANIHTWDWWGRTPLWIAVDRKADAGGGRGVAPLGGGGGAGRGGAPGAGRGGPGGGGPGGPAAAAAGRGPARPPVSSIAMINALLDAGADPNTEMNFHRPNAPNRGRFADNQISTGTTALFRAVQLNDVEAATALLNKGANPNINTMGYTAFLMAAGVGAGGRGAAATVNNAMLDVMTQHGADVNASVTGTKLWSYNVARAQAAGNEGMTALHTAAQSGNLSMVRYLLDKGASADLLNADGKRPVDLVGTGAGRAGAPPAPAAQAKAAPAQGKAGPGQGKGAPAGPSAATLAEIRTLLQAASAKK